jgi:serine/threonine protein kinase
MTTEKFGRYEIKGEIGRGGMATVFHAYDPRFERYVAIKVLPREFLHDPQFRTRFEREAKTVALLEHPAIVPVYDFGEEEGQPYIVMRYMAGGSLSEKLKDGPLPIDEAVNMTTRLATALDAAHETDVIHRDLKPGNILFDRYGNAFLSDFGIARLKQTKSAVTLTGGAILGTPAYMSPEQVQGGTEVDGRSDIYSLGVILYQILSGNTPYQADTPAQVMMMHILEPVPHFGDEETDLPPAFDTVIETAMAKDPDDRYPTAGEMATAIQAAALGVNDTAQLETLVVNGATASIQASAAATVISPPTPPPTSQTGRSISTPIPTPLPGTKTKTGIPKWVWAIGGLVAVTILAFIIIGGGALYFSTRPTATPTMVETEELIIVAAQPSPTHTLTETPVPPTNTQSPTDTESPTKTSPPTFTSTITFTPEPVLTDTPTPPPAAPVIGGADKIAFLKENDVWVANVDGSDLVQLTIDGGEKTNIQWSPDGDVIIYISGLCIQSVSIDVGRIENIACFEYVGTFDAFQISPDGQQAAISLNQQLYIIPYDTDRLSQVTYWTDIQEMATCKELAPYSSNTGTAFAVKQAIWSNDMQRMAMVMLGVDAGRQVDVVRVLDITQCVSNPPRIDEFPSTRFEISGYRNNPVIQNLAWDGVFLFSLNSIVRNEGFGDLYTYNMDLHQAQEKINPISNTCCYRDSSWSPDGSHLAFAFQDINLGPEGSIEIYIVPYGTIGTGLQFTPIPLPENFFTYPKESPQIILRPVQE